MVLTKLPGQMSETLFYLLAAKTCFMLYALTFVFALPKSGGKHNHFVCFLFTRLLNISLVLDSWLWCMLNIKKRNSNTEKSSEQKFKLGLILKQCMERYEEGEM